MAYRFRRRALIFAVAAASSTTPFAAEDAADLRPELEVSGRIECIEINPAGELWFGTATGHVYTSADSNRTWKEATVPVRSDSKKNLLIDLDSISQVRFFDAKHAIITGYIGEAKNAAYRTEDGGSTWSRVALPEGLWVYDSRTTPAGQAWLVGSSGSLLFSNDYGASWKPLKAPFDDVERSYSVHFVSRSLGAVGSLHGSLKVTEDGGFSWRGIKTPAETKVATCHEARIERVRILGSQLIVQQCAGTYARALHGNESWRPFRVQDKPIVSFELFQDGIVAVDAGLNIVRYGADLGDPRPTGFRLEASPLDTAVGAGKAVFLDSNLKVAILSGNQFQSSRMFRAGAAAKWPIEARDRAPDGTFWGVSRFFLYRSHDAGATWERQGELPQEVSGVAVQSSGDVFVWSRHGYTARWKQASRELVEIPGLNGLDVVGLFRRGPLWLVYGGMQYQTTQRIEVSRTYFSGQFAGSADHGFVAASIDGGETWRVVDEWKNEGVQALFLGDDNSLVLMSWLASIRRGRLTLSSDGATASLETILTANPKTRSQVPYVEIARVLDFTGGSDGRIKGWTHELGDFLFQTHDGGYTWESARAVATAPDEIYRLGGGRWLGRVGERDVQLRGDRGYAHLRKFADDIDWSVVDSTGCLILGLKGGDTWMLPADAGEWRSLRTIH